jgi:hypothetical protein
MAFDLAVGMSGDQMNAAAATVYQTLRGKNQVFTGSLPGNYQGEPYTIDYDVQAPPAFDLGTATPQAFALTLPKVALTLTHKETKAQLTLAFTVACQVLNQAGKVSFVPQSVSTPEQPDPVNDWLVQHVVVPAIKTMMTTLLAGVQIPSIQVAGINLTPASVGIVRGYVIAAVNVAKDGAGPPPPPDSSFAWPATPFFALLGNGLVQQLAAIAASSSANQFSGHPSSGDHWAGHELDYSFTLANPRAQIQGTGLKFQFGMSGSIDAIIWFIQIRTDYAFNGTASPDPGVSTDITVENNQLVVKAKTVDDFTMQVTPANAGAWLLVIFMPLISIMVLAIPAMVKSFMQGLQLGSYQIPTYSLVVGSTTLTLTPTDLSVSNVGGMIALTGSAQVTPHLSRGYRARTEDAHGPDPPAGLEHRGLRRKKVPAIPEPCVDHEVHRRDGQLAAREHSGADGAR